MRKKSQGPSLFENAAPAKTPSAPIENANAENVNANAEIENANAPIENANAENVNVGGSVRLSDFVENPDNPQTITDRAFDRLLGKVERIPLGLMAKRIAYVTDHAAGKYVVLSGNKRLRALKRIHGDDAEVPAEWFQDITAMSKDQRDEYIVTANVVEGKWIAKMLVAMFPKDELSRLMDDADVSAILAELPAVQQVAENEEVDQESFGDAMELKIKLTPEDRDKAVEVLDAINPDDMGAAFMSLLTGGKK